jgi:hypothetical protein
MKAINTAVISFLVAIFSVSSLSGEAETTNKPEVEITNQSNTIQVTRASTIQKDGYTLVSFKTKLRNSVLMPIGSHVHVELYNKNGELVEEYIQNLRKHQFHHTVTGRHRPANSNKRIEMANDEIGLIKVQSYTESHKNHS